MAQIVWAAPAIQDMDAIADYIALDNPAAARRLVQPVVAAVDTLRKFPKIGSIPAELQGLPYRQLVVPPCRIFYRIEKRIVYIVHLLRGEQRVHRECFQLEPVPAKRPGKRAESISKKHHR
jgi:toxin ParE1/3/4